VEKRMHSFALFFRKELFSDSTEKKENEWIATKSIPLFVTVE
jgi:hypothetical protein